MHGQEFVVFGVLKGASGVAALDRNAKKHRAEAHQRPAAVTVPLAQECTQLDALDHKRLTPLETKAESLPQTVDLKGDATLGDKKLKDEIVALKDEIVALKDEIVALKKENKALWDRSLERRGATLGDATKQLKHKIEELTKEKKSLLDSIQEQQQQIDERTEMIASLKEACDGFNAQIDNMTVQLDTMERQDEEQALRQCISRLEEAFAAAFRAKLRGNAPSLTVFFSPDAKVTKGARQVWEDFVKQHPALLDPKVQALYRLLKERGNPTADEVSTGLQLVFPGLDLALRASCAALLSSVWEGHADTQGNLPPRFHTRTTGASRKVEET